MNIKEYLAKSNLSLSAFAKLINVGPAAVWRWSSGQFPCKAYAKRIVRVTKGDVQYEDIGWRKEGKHIIRIWKPNA